MEGRQAVSPHTCVLQVEASGGHTDVGLEGQVQIVGRAVQQLGNSCTFTPQNTDDSSNSDSSPSKTQ